ncbi:DNA internalization-related competence protein ComEC/Rec2 [Thalassotalea mangrovi]|uniref:DNA internalization-related competence protein ComEC/Rec2 n=1 Tax=Thalassotalea mangrovi TaxID=2572245 RepID=A0A4U1B326_9GAMM|nr:DNA internalization-related competence protein ComEC/Rec2 [Thalassotalea mangrovi]TKB44117.1 DNA internalization-related competence protein ComEC/Rec2 [Thalassotalea mangrovi]
MEKWLLSFILGAILSLFLPTVPEVFSIIITFTLGLAFLLVKKLRFVSGLLIAAAYIWCQADLHYTVLAANAPATKNLFSEPMRIDATIATLIDKQTTDKRFTVIVDAINDEKLVQPFKVRLSWYRNSPALSQGNRIAAWVKLKPAHGFANPGSFSYQRWLLVSDIVATGYVLFDPPHTTADISATVTMAQRIRNQIDAFIPESEVKPLIFALTLGDRQAFTATHWQVLQSTGTAHLMAISGLHLGIIAALGYWLGRALVLLLPVTLLQTAPAFYVPVMCSLLSALAYAHLSQFSTPTVRALLMLMLFWLIRLSHGRLSLCLWVLAGMVLVIVVQPFSLVSPSFWLSFLALLSILIWVYWSRSSQPPGIITRIWWFVRLQLALAVMLLPINLVLFGQSSWLPWLANLWILPWFSLLLMPTLMLMVLVSSLFPLLASYLAMFSHWQLAFIWEQLRWLDSQQIMVLSRSYQTALCSLTLMAMVMTVLFRSKTMKRNIALLAGASMLMYFIVLPAHQHANRHRWTMSILDVGHGLSIVVEKQRRALIYDTGARFFSGQSIASSVVIPFMKSQWLQTLDYLVISHSDNDHAGGMMDILADFSPTTVVANIPASDDIYKVIEQRKTGNVSQSCQFPRRWSWQGLSFEVLWPDLPRWQENEDSCVLLISDGATNVLLTGDITAAVEAKLLPRLIQHKIDILVAPHHGSRTSSSIAFVDALQPEHVVFSTGYMNRWQLPADDVVARYQQANVKMHNTSVSGMVRFSIDQHRVNNVIASHYRQDLAPLWFLNQFATLAQDKP